MTAPHDERLRKKAEEIANQFAYRDPDGEWWGHDTSLGNDASVVGDIESALLAAKQAGRNEALDQVRHLFVCGDVKLWKAREVLLLIRAIKESFKTPADGKGA